MSEPLYIYPAWLRAKRALMEIVAPLYGGADRINAWFKNHVFEFGQEIFIHKEEMEHVAADMEKYMAYQDEKAIHSIAKEIFKKGLFTKETVADGRHGGGTRLRYMLIVCGAPPSVGPAERHEYE